MKFCTLITTFDSEGEYEGFYVSKGPELNSKNEADALNELGEQGWDFAGVCHNPLERRVYMKHPLRREEPSRYGSEEL